MVPGVGNEPTKKAVKPYPDIGFPNNGSVLRIFLTSHLSEIGSSPMAVACPVYGGSTSSMSLWAIVCFVSFFAKLRSCFSFPTHRTITFVDVGTGDLIDVLAA